MGKLTGGIDYDMIGRLGNHVGRKTKGVNIIAMRPSKSSKPATLLQLDQRLRFGLMTTWTRHFAKVVDTGFAAYDAKMSARNAAVSYNMEHAISGTSPNYTINYAEFMYSKGNLELADTLGASVTVAGKVDFSWTAVVGDSEVKDTDKVTFVVYNSAKNKFVTLIGVVERSALSYALQLPPIFSGDEVETWISFSSADGKKVSDSVHLGKFTVL